MSRLGRQDQQHGRRLAARRDGGGGRRTAPSDTLLLGIIAGTVLVLGIVLLAVRMTPDSYQRFTEETFSCQVIPTWGGARVRAPEVDLPSEPEALKFFLDVSYPMGGFLPFPGSDSFSGFRAVVQTVPDHVVSKFGGSDVDVRWVGVAKMRRQLDPVPRIERRLFDGTETRLHIAIDEMIADLRNGKAEAAALITDLVATEELTGAVGAAKPLYDWLSSAAVRAGAFDLGLLGVRASYWGVTHSQLCPRVISGRGCRYSERRPGYVRLNEVADTPFYVLLMGKGGGAIDEIGRAIHADAKRLNLEAQWDLLTAASEPFDSSLTCSAEKPEDQFALFRDDAGRFRCSRDDKVKLTCSLAADAGVVAESVNVNENWKASGQPGGGAVETSVVAGEVVVSIDCESLRDHRPQEDLRLSIMARGTDDRPSIWEKWTSEEDERDESVGKTLQLMTFVEKVRLKPDQYLIEFEPLLRAATDAP